MIHIVLGGVAINPLYLDARFAEGEDQMVPDPFQPDQKVNKNKRVVFELELTRPMPEGAGEDVPPVVTHRGTYPLGLSIIRGETVDAVVDACSELIRRSLIVYLEAFEKGTANGPSLHVPGQAEEAPQPVQPEQP